MHVIVESKVSPYNQWIVIGHSGLLLCFNNWASIIESRIIIKIGTGKYERMLNVAESSLDKHLIHSLPGLHAFSGRDSASAFYGNGKIKWLNLVKKHKIFCDAICLLDESLDIEETVYEVIEQMVCVAYGFENVEKINEIRYKKCCSKQFPDPTRIPPTRPELRQHVKRVNFQAFIWKKILGSRASYSKCWWLRLRLCWQLL